MAITTLNGLVSALGASTDYAIVNKAAIANQAAAGWTSFWRATGTPAQGAIPGAAAIPTKATTGALLNFSTLSPNNLYVGFVSMQMNQISSQVFLADRLAHMGGLNGTTTTSQTVGISVNTLKGGRCKTDLSDVQWFCEIYTDIGTTGVTATVTYTRDSDATQQTTTITLGGASPANRASRMIPVIPTGTDVIRSIDSVQHATTTTAGSYGFTAYKPLCSLVSSAASLPTVSDWAQTGLPSVAEDACLCFYGISGATTAPSLIGLVKMARG